MIKKFINGKKKNGLYIQNNMKISAFTITTNCIKNQYPVIESIKSVLDKVDELIIVDGHSTDDTVDQIKALNSNKITIIQDKETYWEDDWTYWRMGRNLARGFDECTGDWIIKFDTDYLFQDDYYLRGEFEVMTDEKRYILSLSRRNFQMTDRYFEKSQKTLAVNKKLCIETGLDVKWGYDLKNWGLCDEAIVYKETKDNLLQGDLLRSVAKKGLTGCDIFNYGYSFRSEEVGKELMFRNMRAFYRQQGKGVPTKENIWESYKCACRNAFEKSKQYPVEFSEHPEVIQERIKNLTPDRQGYNYWGHKESKYYDNAKTILG